MNENRQVIITLNIYNLYTYNIPIYTYTCVTNTHVYISFFRSIVMISLGQKKIFVVYFVLRKHRKRGKLSR